MVIILLEDLGVGDVRGAVRQDKVKGASALEQERVKFCELRVR